MNIKSFLKTYYPAVLLLITLLSFTSYAYFDAAASYQLRMSRLFETRLVRVSEAVDKRMIDYVQILKGCQGLFNASDTVTAEDWSIYIKSLNVSSNYPGIQGLAASEYLPLKDSSKVIEKVRRTHPGLHPKFDASGKVITPVILIEPLNFRNQRALGFDLYSEPNRREAIKRAMATGKPALTKKIKLIQETDQDVQPGCLIFLPIYEYGDTEVKNRKVKGFVANVFRTHDLMHALLYNFQDLDIKIYDGTRSIEEQVIYFTKLQPVSSSGSDSKLQGDTILNIAGTPWKIVISANEKFGSSIERQQPFLILIIGLIISILLFILVLNTIKRRIDIAEELKRSRILEQKKDEFIGIASHELKTPLTSIKATVQLLERADLKQKESFLLTKASQNIDKLQKLIGDLLDVSKIQTGQLSLNLAPVSIVSLIHNSIENVAHLYHDRKIVTKQNVPDITILADNYRLEQALNNLLTNAIKYSPASSTVFIDVKVLEKQLRIDVIDNGIGISKKDQKRVFERFFRSEALAPVISGLGMGLYISYQIVKQHNGDIGVESEAGKGSTFFILLPLQTTGTERPQP